MGFEGSPQSHFDIKERWHCYLRLEIPASEGERETRTLVIKNVQRTFYDTQLHLRVESFWITPSSWQAGLDKGWVPKSEKIGGLLFMQLKWEGVLNAIYPWVICLTFLVSLHIKNAVLTMVP